MQSYLPRYLLTNSVAWKYPNRADARLPLLCPNPPLNTKTRTKPHTNRRGKKKILQRDFCKVPSNRTRSPFSHQVKSGLSTFPKESKIKFFVKFSKNWDKSVRDSPSCSSWLHFSWSCPNECIQFSKISLWKLNTFHLCIRIRCNIMFVCVYVIIILDIYFRISFWYESNIEKKLSYCGVAGKKKNKTRRKERIKKKKKKKGEFGLFFFFFFFSGLVAFMKETKQGLYGV